MHGSERLFIIARILPPKSLLNFFNGRVSHTVLDILDVVVHVYVSVLSEKIAYMSHNDSGSEEMNL